MSTTANTTSDVILPANKLAAIYDIDTKLLYLYASGHYPSTTLLTFKRDEKFVGGLRYIFEGLFAQDNDTAENVDKEFAEKFEINMDEHFNYDTVIITVSGGHGREAIDKEVKILKVPMYQQSGFH